ncbi:MAG: hypothetical protein KAI24_09505, partial [Planctomycetes bacterium]|nr:hypothetical protein [Planctomycetota bacterium]
MIGSEPGEPTGIDAGEAGVDLAGAHGARAGSRWSAAAAVLALAVALGAFAQVQVLVDAELVAAGRRVPAHGWLHGCRDWLPLLCIGFGLARLFVWRRATGHALRLGAVFCVFAFAVAAALFPAGAAPSLDGANLLAATAGVLGVAIGLHAEAARRAGLPGVLVGA